MFISPYIREGSGLKLFRHTHDFFDLVDLPLHP